jgi:hypothetical protein
MNAFPLANNTVNDHRIARTSHFAFRGLGLLLVILGLSSAAFGQSSGAGAYAWSGGSWAWSYAWSGANTAPAPNPAPDPNDDAYEENDTPEQAKMIGAGTLQLQGLDDDWFYVSLTDEGDFAVSISGHEGDLDLYVLDGAGNVLGASEEVGSEESLYGTLDAGEYLIVVTPYEGQTSSYTLEVSGPCAAAPTPTTQPASDSDLQVDAQITIPVSCGVGTPIPTMLLTLGLMGFGMLGRRRTR